MYSQWDNRNLIEQGAKPMSLERFPRLWHSNHHHKPTLWPLLNQTLWDSHRHQRQLSNKQSTKISISHRLLHGCTINHHLNQALVNSLRKTLISHRHQASGNHLLGYLINHLLKCTISHRYKTSTNLRRCLVSLLPVSVATHLVNHHSNLTNKQQQ